MEKSAISRQAIGSDTPTTLAPRSVVEKNRPNVLVTGMLDSGMGG